MASQFWQNGNPQDVGKEAAARLGIRRGDEEYPVELHLLHTTDGLSRLKPLKSSD